jgi:hypothetical protein
VAGRRHKHESRKPSPGFFFLPTIGIFPGEMMCHGREFTGPRGNGLGLPPALHLSLLLPSSQNFAGVVSPVGAETEKPGEVSHCPTRLCTILCLT